MTGDRATLTDMMQFARDFERFYKPRAAIRDKEEVVIEPWGWVLPIARECRERDLYVYVAKQREMLDALSYTLAKRDGTAEERGAPKNVDESVQRLADKTVRFILK